MTGAYVTTEMVALSRGRQNAFICQTVLIRRELPEDLRYDEETGMPIVKGGKATL